MVPRGGLEPPRVSRPPTHKPVVCTGFTVCPIAPPKSYGNNGLKCINTSRTGLRFPPANQFSAGSSTFFQVSSGSYLFIAVATFAVFFPKSFW